MATEGQPPTTTPSVLSLPQRIAQFKGKSFSLLVALLKSPDSYWTDVCRSVGCDDTYSYALRKQPGFEELVQEIRSHAGDLRSEYAQAAMREAIPPIVDKMIAVAATDSRDAQRARERILETVGVLPKGNEQLQQAPIQVVTHTYVLVQPGTPGRQGVVVEAQARGLPPSTEST